MVFKGLGYRSRTELRVFVLDTAVKTKAIK